MSPRVGLPPVAVLLLFAGLAGGQSTTSKADEAARLRQHITPARRPASASLSTHLMRALRVNSVGFSWKDSIVELHLENWKRGLSVDTIAPIAREGLTIFLREDSTARRATVLKARFSDYTPQVVTLTWSAADFKAHPERFRVTRSK